MAKYKPPIAHIVQSIKIGETIKTILRLNKLPSEPIAPALIYAQTEPPEKLLELHSLVERKEDSFAFITYDAESSPLHSGHSYDFYPQWNPGQLELAQDSNRQWRKETFAKKDMITFKAKTGTIGRKLEEGEKIKGGTVVPGGWDHVHCELCFETISAEKGCTHYGFTDGNEWLCEACHEKYIASGFGKKLGETG